MNMSEERLQIKMIIIANDHGIPLVSVKIDDTLQEELISPFFSSIHQFADKGGLEAEETKINMNSLEIIINRKNGLMLIGIFDESIKKLQSMQGNMYMMLDLFREMFKEEITAMAENKSVDMNIFKKFEVLIERQIRAYLKEVKEDGGKKTKGIFGKLMSLLKKKK
jgi:hypothetical protein